MIFPKQISWLDVEKQNLTQQITHSPIKRNVQQHKINTKKLKPGLVASYNIRPGNGEGLFWFWWFINLSLTYTLTYSPRSTGHIMVIKKLVVAVVIDSANDYKHGFIPRLIEWRVISMAEQCNPSLTVLGYLKQPVTQSRSTIAACVAQGVAGRQQPHAEINCKPRFSTNTSAQTAFISHQCIQTPKNIQYQTLQWTIRTQWKLFQVHFGGLIAYLIPLLHLFWKRIFVVKRWRFFTQQVPLMTDKLQRVLNAAARLVSGTRKYDRGLSQILHSDLHWLDVADRVQYKLDVTVHRCLHNKAPQYLIDCCVPVSDIASRQRLRSACRLLTVPRHRRTTLGRRAFSVAGPAVWNLLPDQLSALSLHSDSHWRHSSSTSISVLQHIRDVTIMHYINLHFTYLLTYSLSPNRHYQHSEWRSKLWPHPSSSTFLNHQLTLDRRNTDPVCWFFDAWTYGKTWAYFNSNHNDNCKLVR